MHRQQVVGLPPVKTVPLLAHGQGEIQKPWTVQHATIALEVAADTNTLGAVASKTGMQSVHLLERVDH